MEAWTTPLSALAMSKPWYFPQILYLMHFLCGYSVLLLKLATKAGGFQLLLVWLELARKSPPVPFQLVTGRVWQGTAFGGLPQCV